MFRGIRSNNNNNNSSNKRNSSNHTEFGYDQDDHDNHDLGPIELIPTVPTSSTINNNISSGNDYDHDHEDQYIDDQDDDDDDDANNDDDILNDDDDNNDEHQHDVNNNDSVAATAVASSSSSASASVNGSPNMRTPTTRISQINQQHQPQPQPQQQHHQHRTKMAKHPTTLSISILGSSLDHIPRRVLLLSIFLSIVGIIFLSIGIGLLPTHPLSDTLPLLIMGSLTLIPGIYHLVIIFLATQQLYGWTYERLPRYA